MSTVACAMSSPVPEVKSPDKQLSKPHVATLCECISFTFHSDIKAHPRASVAPRIPRHPVASQTRAGHHREVHMRSSLLHR